MRNKYVTIKSAAVMLGTTPANIGRWCRAGKIRATKKERTELWGHLWQIPKEEVSRLLSAKEGRVLGETLTAKEVAERLGVHLTVIHKWCREGRIRAAKKKWSKIWDCTWQIPKEEIFRLLLNEEYGFLSVKEAARILGVRVKVVYYLVDGGKLHAKKNFKGEYRILKVQILNLLKSKRGLLQTSVARRLGYSKAFICQLLREGRLQGTKDYKGQWRIRRGSVYRFLFVRAIRRMAACLQKAFFRW